jgi:hypothetical protein
MNSVNPVVLDLIEQVVWDLVTRVAMEERLGVNLFLMVADHTVAVEIVLLSLAIVVDVLTNSHALTDGSALPLGSKALGSQSCFLVNRLMILHHWLGSKICWYLVNDLQ